MSVFTIKEDKGIKYLYKNKQPCFCIYKQPIISENPISREVQISNTPCCSTCQAFETTKDEVILHCIKFKAKTDD